MAHWMTATHIDGPWLALELWVLDISLAIVFRINYGSKKTDGRIEYIPGRMPPRHADARFRQSVRRSWSGT
jgi:hypothetical protein